MDNPNITMEEYIMLEELGKVFNWETAKYGRIWYDKDNHELRSVENEFPAITFNDSSTSGETLSCEPTVSSLNDEIDFRILFDDSDDEDYMPTISCIDDLVFFKDFENEFPAIVYNDALTSKSNFLTEPTLIITEYLVNISKRRAFWSLNEDILKITVLITNTPYPSRKIWGIRACTHQRPQRKHDQYAISREDQYAVLEI
ncbi:hypothetical protein Tco_1080087 [Tanacetum coccineum]|uniref:PiggyBac transposable element-derived protein domain-containing protein n=1 Tax=Tanacetum coccineum TaxID=301880 RepID=A0ABQ5HVE0_9ASTR